MLGGDESDSAENRQESESVANARRRVAALRESSGPRHPEYASSLNQLALLHITLGDSAVAEPLHRETLEIRRESLG
jgi:hypothetical protein